MLYAFQLMPVSYTGLSLIAIGIIFMIFEAMLPSFGILGIGGIAAFIIGSIMLFDMNDPHYQLSWATVIAMSVFSISFFILVLNMAFRSQKKAITTGKEGLIGKEGIVINVMNEQIVVQVMGEIWSARCKEC